MRENILQQLRHKILHSKYVVTTHAYDEMADDDLSVWDMESVFLTGQITERQKDAMTAESKFRIKGKSLDNRNAEVIAKFSVTGKVIIITIYAL